MADPLPHVFLSYASADRGRVMPVAEALERVDVTLTAGDAILVHGDTPNSARNNGAETAMLLVPFLLPAEALGPPPGAPDAGTQAGTPAG